jgi:fructose-bisphosphate aldolase class II
MLSSITATEWYLWNVCQRRHFGLRKTNLIFGSVQQGFVEKLGLPLILALAEAHIGENITLVDAAAIGRKYA